MATKADEYRELRDEEIAERIAEAKEELFNLRFQLATGQLDNPGVIKQVRHDVARMATVLRERQLEVAYAAAEAEAEDEAEDEDEAGYQDEDQQDEGQESDGE